MNNERDWVNCTVCGEPDMSQTTDADGNKLINCVNHACASNGGENKSALETDETAKFIAFQRWKRRTGISEKMLAKCIDIMTDIVNNKKENNNERPTPTKRNQVRTRISKPKRHR